MDVKKTFFLTLPCLAFIGLVIAFALIFIYAPEERTQGLVQKIFYFHVSSAFAMYAGFLMSGIFGAAYLWKRKQIYDILSHTGATIGLVFCTLVLISGPIWAKPTWGSWWTWDPRLTSTLLIWLVFFSSLLLRRFFGSDDRGRLFAAILAIFGVLDIPLIIFAVKLWRGIHPNVLGKQGGMPSEMKLTWLVTAVSVLILFSVISWVYARILLAEDRTNALTDLLEERD